MGFEIGDREPIEPSLAEHGAQAAKVFLERAEDAPPVLLIVDFQPLEGGEPVVALDEAAGDFG